MCPHIINNWHDHRSAYTGAFISIGQLMSSPLKIKNRYSWFKYLYAFHALLFSLAFAWWVLCHSAFLYPVFHDHAGIGEAIDTYAPENKYIKGFGTTSRQERIRVFEAINYAVHNAGKGLSEIHFQSAETHTPQKLLRQPEVIHLIDVANLISLFKPLFWYALAAFPIMVAWLFWMRRKRSALYVTLPKMRDHGVVLAALAALVVLPMLVFGAETVFNQLHVWVFPDEHQWFFYYQESLMSTLMYAPHLFGYIGLAWAILFVISYSVGQWLVSRFYSAP